MSIRRRSVFKEHLRSGAGTRLSATPKPVDCEGDSGLAYLLREAGRRTRAEYIVALALDHGQDAAIETACDQDGQSTFGRKQPDARHAANIVARSAATVGGAK